MRTLVMGLISAFCFFSLITSFQNTYLIAHANHAEGYNMYQDCQLPHFNSRYPTVCAKIALDPPKAFMYTWTKTAISEFSICGPIPCSDLLSIKSIGILSMILSAFKLILSTPL